MDNKDLEKIIFIGKSIYDYKNLSMINIINDLKYITKRDNTTIKKTVNSYYELCLNNNKTI